MKTPENPGRIAYIDWLRVIAVLLLFPFHTGEIFTPRNFYVKNADVSGIITFVNSFIYQWHMPLFMFLAGIGSHFALRFRSSGEYALERVTRLFVPLMFGILVIIPPQAYLRMFGDPARVWPAGFTHNAPGAGYNANFFEFYPSFFNGIYPDGNFEWGHLWFLAYLLTFSLMAIPVFMYLKSGKGATVIERLAAMAEKKFGLIAFILPIAVIEISLRWRFPGLQNLIADWANFFTYFTVFVYGYLVMADRRFLHAIERHWKGSLAAGVVLNLALASVFVSGIGVNGMPVPLYAALMTMRAATICCCCSGLLGLGKHLLNRGGAFIEYAKEAALPYYILHQTAVIITGFYIVALPIPMAAKFIGTVAASFVLTAAVYESAVRRVPALRFFFGMKRKIPVPAYIAAGVPEGRR